MSKFVPSGSRSAREQSLQEARRREREAEEARKKKEKKIILLVVGIAVILALIVTVVVVLVTRNTPKPAEGAGTKESATQAPAETWPEHVAPKMSDLDLSEVNPTNVVPTEDRTDYVRMTIRDFGEVVIRLFPDVAPITVENFKNLVAEGFYDGLTFHRIVDDFMAQGGDAYGREDKTQPASIRGEFTSNGWENNLSHVRGVISMARTSAPNTASGQFFIMLGDKYTSSLEGRYASFGYVCAGMDLMDEVSKVERTLNSNGEKATPVEPVVIDKIEFVTVQD